MPDLIRPIAGARQPSSPSGNPWLDRATEALRLAEDARADGCTTVSLAAALLAAQYLQLAKLRRGAH